MSRIKLYYDTLSQPSRTVAIFLQTNKIPFDAKLVRLGKGDQRTEEFKKLNPLQLVPVIEDNGFVLRESVAILRYLCREKKVPEHWYPKSSKEQARIDEYLEWQHLGTRIHCGLYFRVMWLEPFITKKAPSESYAQKLKENMVKACDVVESVWLSDKKFICGEKISIADLFAATELEQPKLAGYDPRVGRPNLAAWLERVRQETNPYYDEIHFILNKIAGKFEGKSPALVGAKQ